MLFRNNGRHILRLQKSEKFGWVSTQPSQNNIARLSFFPVARLQRLQFVTREDGSYQIPHGTRYFNSHFLTKQNVIDLVSRRWKGNTSWNLWNEKKTRSSQSIREKEQRSKKGAREREGSFCIFFLSLSLLSLSINIHPASSAARSQCNCPAQN